MKTVSSDSGRFTMETTARETFICRAALREVLFGFKFPEFEPRMGCTRSKVAAVFEALPLGTPLASDSENVPPRLSRSARAGRSSSDRVKQVAANIPTTPQDAIASPFQRLVRRFFVPYPEMCLTMTVRT